MTIFAKRHYEAIALVCQQQRLDQNQFGLKGVKTGHFEEMERRLADMFKADNPTFDRDRFLFACIPGSNVKAKTAHLKVAS